MVIYLYRYAINVTIFYQNISEDTLNTYWKFTSCGAIFISLNKIKNNNNEDKIGAFQFQQLESFETKLTEKIFDLPILNVQGGTYPSSKINCVIGQVMLSVWGTITFCHI